MNEVMNNWLWDDLRDWESDVSSVNVKTLIQEINGVVDGVVNSWLVFCILHNQGALKLGEVP